MFDLGIINGRIYLDGKWIEGNIYTKDEKIACISSLCLKAKEEYDADGNWVLPGFIDSHVHFELNAGRYTSADSFYSGSVAAAFGGVTTIIDFLDPTSKYDDLNSAFLKRMSKAQKSIVDYSFHSTIANLNEYSNSFFDDIVSLGIPSIKVFTTYSSTNRKTSDRVIDSILAVSKSKNIMLLVHAENDGIALEGQKIPVAFHEDSRPAISEISEVLKIAEMASYRDGHVYIVHNSCGTTIDSLKKRYGDLLNKDIIIESCPHYFTFTKNKYYKEDGYLYTMTPPLRSSVECNKLIENIDDVFVIATDHCPFKIDEKNNLFASELPMGVGGIEHSFIVMFNTFGEKIIDKFTKNPARAHGLYPQKGNLLPGADADIVVFDPNLNQIITNDSSSGAYSIYNGMEVKGKVIATVCRGNFLVKDEMLVGGNGKFIKRRIEKL